MIVGWPDNWSPIVDAHERTLFAKELFLELKPGHVLHGVAAIAVARHSSTDDVLFEIRDGSGRVADVHLTWQGEREKPPWPMTSVFESLAAWIGDRG